MAALVFDFVDGTQEVVWPGSPRHRELLQDGHTPQGSVPEPDGISDALEAFLSDRFGAAVDTTDAAVALVLSTGAASPAAVSDAIAGEVADPASAASTALSATFGPSGVDLSGGSVTLSAGQTSHETLTLSGSTASRTVTIPAAESGGPRVVNDTDHDHTLIRSGASVGVVLLAGASITLRA